MTTDEQRCERLRNTLLNAQNRIQQVVPDLHRAKTEKREIEAQIRQINSEISQAEIQQQISRSAPRALGPGGAAVSVLGQVEAEIRLSRLKR